MNLNAVLARVKKLEEGKSGKYVWLTLHNGMRYRITSKRMLAAMQSEGSDDYNAMLNAKGCSDGSRLWELFQACV